MGAIFCGPSNRPRSAIARQSVESSDVDASYSNPTLEDIAHSLESNRMDLLVFPDTGDALSRLRDLAPSIRRCTSLRQVIVSDLGDVGAELLCDVLSQSRSVQRLSLTGGSGTMFDALTTTARTSAAIATLLRTNTSLTEVVLRGLSLGVDGVAAIAKALEGANSTLARLHLGFTLQDGYLSNGFESVAAMLRANTTLQHLALSDNTVSPEDAQQLGGALAVNRSLVSLSLRRCALSN
jgi:Ran GTPase-activating protein (RanGAP) involved in mRNA processing and transport